MKKLLGVLLVLTALIFTGCDNNKGPFEIKRENGHKVLYSNGKLAKGMIQSTWYDYNSGESVVTSTYYVEKGIPAGDFTLYDRTGNMIVKFEGKTKDGLFVGKMTGETYKSKGDYNLNPDWLLTYDGNDIYQASRLYKDVLYTGKINSEAEKYSKLNGNPDGKVEIYNTVTGKLKEEELWKNGEVQKSKIYWDDGPLRMIFDYIKDENNRDTTVEFDRDGKVTNITLYTDLKNSRSSSYTDHFTINYNGSIFKAGNIFNKMTAEEILAKYSKKYNFKI